MAARWAIEACIAALYSLQVQRARSVMRLSIGGSADGPHSHASAMSPYAASVRWVPSQFTAADGSAHAVAAPGRPHSAATL